MASNSDVLIIGGGAIGLSIARTLALAKASVIVLDQPRPGKATPAAAGMLETPSPDCHEKFFFDLCLNSRLLYPQLAAELVEETGIDIELNFCGRLQFLSSSSEHALWSERARELEQAGLSVQLLSAAETREIEPGAGECPFGALRIDDDGYLSNRELLRALELSCDRLGVRRFADLSATSLIRRGDSVLGARGINDRFTAAMTILAAGCWSGELARSISVPLPVHPIRGQMISLRLTEQPTHILHLGSSYLVPRLSGIVLVGSTLEEAGFEVLNTPDGLEELCKNATRIWPALRSAPLDRLWAGLRPATPDQLPLLGPLAEIDGLIVATGHFRNGILLTPITARLIGALTLEGASPVDLEPFRPDRFLKPSGS